MTCFKCNDRAKALEADSDHGIVLAVCNKHTGKGPEFKQYPLGENGMTPPVQAKYLEETWAMRFPR